MHHHRSLGTFVFENLSKVFILSCPGKITLRDLKRCKLSHIFFDTFFNIEKYLDHEQKDPFSVIRVSSNR